MDNIKVSKIKLYVLLFAAIMLCSTPALIAKAETASAITFGTINYELLTMQVFNNNNTIVYYSTDNSTWTEVDGAYNGTTKSYSMDISWISNTSDATLYFKGDVFKTIKTITLPMQNNTFDVNFDKVEGSFTFNNAEESDVFEWRKSSDYNWQTVDMEENSSTYTKFLTMIEKFRVSGATIVLRLPQVIGTGVNNVGMRPSKEDSITIAARANAPTVKVNSSKLTLTTTTIMEYYDTTNGLWLECSGTMHLEDIAPDVLYENGATATTLKIRKTATTSSTYSKTQNLYIPAQKAAPVIGDSSSDVTYYYMNSKLMLQFNKASATNMYEYAIIKEYADFNVSTAAWKAVKATNVLTLSSSVAPNGCTVYVRKKGTDAATNISLVLASATNSFTVKY